MRWEVAVFRKWVRINFSGELWHSYATKILPYRGIGSGIIRALKEYPDIDFADDHDGNRFIVSIRRREYDRMV